MLAGWDAVVSIILLIGLIAAVVAGLKGPSSPTLSRGASRKEKAKSLKDWEP